MYPIILKNILLGISLAAPLGPVSITIINRSIQKGFGAGISIAAGAVLGDFLCYLLSYYGLGSAAASQELFHIIVGMGGALMLIFFGIGNIRSGWSKVKLSEENRPDRKYIGNNPVLIGFALALANPVSIVWWLGVFGAQMADHAPDYSVEEFFFNSMIIVGVILWSLFLAFFCSMGKKAIKESHLQWVSIIAGCVLVVFGIHFGLQAMQLIG